jgi:hypothetical protein
MAHKLKRRCIQLLGWVLEGKNRLEKSRCRWRTIKMVVIKKYSGMNLDRDRWQAVEHDGI